MVDKRHAAVVRFGEHHPLNPHCECSLRCLVPSAARVRVGRDEAGLGQRLDAVQEACVGAGQLLVHSEPP
jgi:hypothetical protein